MPNIRSRSRATVIAAFAFIAIVYTTFGQAPQQLEPQTPPPAILQNYQPVTAERLKNPEPGNWLMIRRTYDGQGYSPLDQINTGNVTKLRPVWAAASRPGTVPRRAQSSSGHHEPKQFLTRSPPLP